MQTTEAPDRPRGFLWLVVAIVLLVVVGIVLARWIDAAGGPAAIRHALGPTAPFVIVPVIAAVSSTPVPSELIALPAAAIYGFWPGAAIIWTAWMLASFLQYFVAGRIARGFDLERARSRMPGRLARFPVSHPAFLIVARWLPMGPHLVNSAAGACGVPLPRHALCAAVSIVPQALVLSAAANAILLL